MGEKRVHPVPDEMLGRLVPPGEQNDARADDLVLAEVVPTLFRGDQPAHQIVRWVCASRLHEFP